MSKQILEVEGRSISMLPRNSDFPEEINVPIDLPILEAGRIQYYETDNFNDIPFNIDWIIFKTIDPTILAVDDVRFAVIIFGSILFCVCIIFARFYKKESDDDDNIGTGYDGTLFDIHTDQNKRNLSDVMKQMQPIISDSAKATWTKLYGGYDGILTTSIAQDFCANEANALIAAHDNETYYSMLIKCSWTYSYFTSHSNDSTNTIKFKHNFIDFIESSLYNFIIGFTIVIHLIVSLFEPATPQQLQKHGLDNEILISLVLCLFIEFVDLILVGIKRFIEFSSDKHLLIKLYELNYDVDHKYVRILKSIPSQFNNNNNS
eukprot:26851_1